MKIPKLAVKQKSMLGGDFYLAASNDGSRYQVREFISIGFAEIPLRIETPNCWILGTWRHDDLCLNLSKTERNQDWVAWNKEKNRESGK